MYRNIDSKNFVVKKNVEGKQLKERRANDNEMVQGRGSEKGYDTREKTIN